MSGPTLLDHLLFAAFALAYPAYGYATWPRFLAEARAGRRDARARAYLETIAVEWGLTIALLGYWAVQARPWPRLGLGAPFAGASAIALLVVLVLGGVAFAHARAVARAPVDQLVAARVRIGQLVDLMPHTRAERWLFAGVSLTAGTCEELFFRGLAPWLLAEWMPPWAAVAAATALFGLAHAYQGLAAIPKTALLGAIMAALTVWAGTLWPAIVLHSIIDLHGGSVGGRIATAQPPAQRDEAPPA